MAFQTSAKPGASLKPETEITYIKGVGPKRAAVLNEAGLFTFFDLLYHFPRRYLNRSTITPIAKLHAGEEATIVGKVLSQHLAKTRRRSYYQVLVGDESGQITCVWFNGVNYIKNVFESGDAVAMSGKVEFFNGYQIVHPDYDKLEAEDWDTLHTARIIPLYPSGAGLKRVGLDSRGFRRLLKPAVENLPPEIGEILPQFVLEKYRLPGISAALREIHFPESMTSLEAARARFKFEELFYLQLMLAVKRSGIKALKKPFTYDSPGSLLKSIYEKLPFELTAAQKRVVKEIWRDMKAPETMNRLVQGDVGSGKTIVALLAASIAISNGYQVAFMAPTEILAEQHYRNLGKFTGAFGIEIRLLIGGQKKSERDSILTGIQSGEVQLVVGTHALIQENVEFKNMALAIIDEQHRFGVLQRGQLIAKGLNPDVLVMTATPIPRTLSMTLYGDMDVSVIDELPSRKAKIITRLVNEDKLADVYSYIREQVQNGNQAYIVYPLIEESEKLDLNAAIQGFEYLRKHVYPELRLALIHGGMNSQDKESVMNSFADGTTDILVSTTVIEVGVDNPNATVMVIENAERFGLTQLHQLRGRIGRGEKTGVCALVERKRSETSHQRIETILSSTNGFEISEEDLKLRGPGEFYGTRQHGIPKMKIADLILDYPLLKTAREEAFRLLEHDPHLRRMENQAIRTHLLKNYAEYMEFVNVL